MPSTKALSRIYPCKHIDHFIDMYWFTYTSRYRLQGWDHQNIRGKSRFHNRFYHLRVCFMVTTNPEIAFHAHLDRIFIFTNEIPRFHISKALVAPTYLAEPRHSYMDIHMITHSALFEKSVVTTLINSFFAHDACCISMIHYHWHICIECGIWCWNVLSFSSYLQFLARFS